MVNQLIQLLLLILASILVMILHELPKAIYFANTYKQDRPSYKKNIFAIYQYIDPIGLIFCVTANAGFSKPYVYRLNDKKNNKAMSIIGFASLLCVFFLSMLLLNIMTINTVNIPFKDASLFYKLAFTFILYMATTSMGMFLVNLFPIATFDMGLLIASRSFDAYNSVVKNDFAIKIILLLFLMFNILPNLTLIIMNIFLIT